LQGPKRIGKSTVIRTAIDILAENSPLSIGGFYTWKQDKTDQHVYMRPARSDADGEIYRLAGYDETSGRMIGNIETFENDGVRLLSMRDGVDLIVMDELGFLESDAPMFRQAVMDALDGDIPVIGALRQGEVAWHEAIKRHPMVTVLIVDEKNRDAMPREIVFSIEMRLRATRE